MLMMEPSRYPSRAFTSAHVRRRDMHLWTGVQLLLFGILYVVKTVKAVAIAFRRARARASARSASS